MNYDQPPRTNWVKVLAFVLGGLALLFVLLAFTGYYILMHTSVPFKMIEAMLAQGGTNQDFKIEGISGSIAEGFKIKSITWGEKGKGASQIEDVRLLYSNFWDLMGGDKVIFKEIHIGKAHLDVTGIEELLSPTNSVDLDDASADDEEDTNTVAQADVPAWTNPPPVWRTRTSRRATRRPFGVAKTKSQLFQIDKLGIEDVFITNRVTGFSLSVPALEWKGFKAVGDNVELGELTINSDRLKVETKPGETAEVNGQQVKFQKKLEGTILPLLHKSVRQPIVFTIDAVPTGSNLVWRMTSFDSRMEVYHAADESGFFRCKDADLKAYFDAPVPEHLTTEAITSTKGAKQTVKLGKGSFKLGASQFEIQPHEWQKTSGSSTNRLTAVNRTGTSVITYQVLIPDEPWKVEQRLSSEPPSKPEELLARVYYAKPFAQLTDAEQKSVAAKKSGFSGWPKDPKSQTSKPKAETPELETGKP